MASPFVVGSVDFVVPSSVPLTIFSDVETAKSELLEIRRNAKNRPDNRVNGRIGQSASTSSTPNPVNRDLQNYRSTLRLLLQSESALDGIRSTRRALEIRRESIQRDILALRNEIETTNVPEGDGTTLQDDAGNQPARKRQRYFETSGQSAVSSTKPTVKSGDKESVATPMETDDLSTVVCPFELLGRCTDPSCPHMHLDR